MSLVVDPPSTVTLAQFKKSAEPTLVVEAWKDVDTPQAGMSNVFLKVL